jgi:hypothetical protein
MSDDKVPSQPLTNGRGSDYCRGCNGVRLFSALDLGSLPIANELLVSKNSVIWDRSPMLSPRIEFFEIIVTYLQLALLF